MRKCQRARFHSRNGRMIQLQQNKTTPKFNQIKIESLIFRIPGNGEKPYHSNLRTQLLRFQYRPSDSRHSKRVHGKTKLNSQILVLFTKRDRRVCSSASQPNLVFHFFLPPIDHRFLCCDRCHLILFAAVSFRNLVKDWKNPIRDTEEYRDSILEILSDARVVAPVIQMADLHSSIRQRSYFYVFTHQTTNGDYPQVMS